MCGPENTNRPRGGALVALCPPALAATMPTSASPFSGVIRGDLAFHTPGFPGSTEATHARLTPENALDLGQLSDLHIVIHSSGDLTRSADECGLFRQISLSTMAMASPSSSAYLELPLESPLSLQVGNEGIIGRRVSLYSRPCPGINRMVAEGIVGFNFNASSPMSSL
ncbi:hypothetical protein PT974_04535 [Cladobotryum mycophilum]|uniref:Uncharacterized protein n=1 Tax=Cladobotryum mycophilum TaxID=491253 RepID=A0ABR0SVF3_9HYPO